MTADASVPENQAFCAKLRKLPPFPHGESQIVNRLDEPRHCNRLAGQVGQKFDKQFLVWIAACQMENDSTCRYLYNSGYFQQLIPDRVSLRLFHFRVFQSLSSKSFHQNISRRGQDQPKLISQKIMAAGTVRKKVELLLFDAVFHITPPAKSA